MLKKRKLLAGLATALIITSACAVSASAYDLTATLGTKDTVKYSGTYTGRGGGTLYGSNDAQSAGVVRVLAKHKYLGVWTQDCSFDLAPGKESKVDTRKYATDHTWQLGLNPAGALRYGCMATGRLSVFK